MRWRSCSCSSVTPTLTFSQTALARKSALQRFEEGKLGMILGFRDLTPRLRERKGLNFDVMPMPRLSGGASIARMSGLCISAKSEHVDQAADLLTDVDLRRRGEATWRPPAT